MFVAVIVLLLNGQPIVEGHSQQTFKGVNMEGGCGEWLQSHAPVLAEPLKARGLEFTIEARCDREA